MSRRIKKKHEYFASFRYETDNGKEYQTGITVHTRYRKPDELVDWITEEFRRMKEEQKGEKITQLAMVCLSKL